MLIEELTIENVRCFEKTPLKFKNKNWVTLLGQNGCGKSTVLQSLGLLLAGPEGAQILAARPVGWLRDESQRGKLSIKIHQGDSDPGSFGSQKVTRSFGYSFFITGSDQLTVGNKLYTAPGVHAVQEKRLTWLRQNAFTSKGTGWFAVGYGAFRRLTRKSEIIVPSLESPTRYTNFFTQFDEDQPLSAFERWMVYLDYSIVKSDAGEQRHKEAKRQKELGIDAINSVLPHGVRFDSVTAEGRVLFDVGGVKVPTLALSDGYRSVLALTGDLIWRLIQAFPESSDPLKEEGVVLIDELDIHLHPIWQRDIALRLRKQFPNLQFIVATHSPFIAAGAGEEALTLKFSLSDGKTLVEEVRNFSALSVDRVLQSDAFGNVSPYSPQTQEKIDRYDTLLVKRTKLSDKEKTEFEQLSLFVETARPIGGPPEPGSLQSRIEAYLEKTLP
ncbi:MAG: AAA family ATPase [Rhodocyclaceae bacterium]|nr:AAA family ATPase [Rhodocyclaceae bacterium]